MKGLDKLCPVCNDSPMNININSLTRPFVEVDISEPHEPLLCIGVDKKDDGGIVVTLTQTDHHGTMRTKRLVVLDNVGRVL